METRPSKQSEEVLWKGMDCTQDRVFAGPACKMGREIRKCLSRAIVPQATALSNQRETQGDGMAGNVLHVGVGMRRGAQYAHV